MVMSLASMPAKNKVRPDPIPRIREAGKHILTGGHNADLCIRADLFPYEKPGNPGTPEHLKRLRKLNNMAPGVIQVHPGLQNDKQPVPEGHTYGKPGYGSDHVDMVIKSQNFSGLADKFNETKERRYQSHIREPLGKTYNRNYVWPDLADNGRMAFGLPSREEINAKELLYPRNGAAPEDRVHSEMYKKTHANYEAGEQRNREYEWHLNPVIQGRP